jgi:type IV secretory pathway VirB2 component (pilin)
MSVLYFVAAALVTVGIHTIVGTTKVGWQRVINLITRVFYVFLLVYAGLHL